MVELNFILSSRMLFAINDSMFLLTYLLMGLAPKDSLYDELMIYSFAFNVKFIFNCLSCNLDSIFLMMLSNIS